MTMRDLKRLLASPIGFLVFFIVGLISVGLLHDWRDRTNCIDTCDRARAYPTHDLCEFHCKWRKS